MVPRRSDQPAPSLPNKEPTSEDVLHIGEQEQPQSNGTKPANRKRALSTSESSAPTSILSSPEPEIDSHSPRRGRGRKRPRHLSPRNEIVCCSPDTYATSSDSESADELTPRPIRQSGNPFSQPDEPNADLTALQHPTDDGGPSHIPRVVVRAPTWRPDSTDPLPQPHQRGLYFLRPALDIPNSARAPTAGACPKSPAPSICDGDQFEMEDIFPLEILVTVRMTIQGDAPYCKEVTIENFDWVSPGGYEDLLPNRILERHLAEVREQDSRTREYYHRHGSCRVRTSWPGLVSNEEYYILDDAEILRQAAIQIICGFMSEHPFQEFSLEVYWDYGSAQLKPEPEDAYGLDFPYKDLIKQEIGKKMQKNFLGQKYISRRDLRIFQQLHIIRDLVFDDKDSSLVKLNETAKDEFVNAIVELPAVRLMVICVYKGINLKFLHHLIFEHEVSDKAPTGKKEDCRPSCRENHKTIISVIPRFSARNVSNDYNHYDLDQGDVMPLCSTRPEINLEQIGYGASSHVYAVTIDPAHHYLSGNPGCQFALKKFPRSRVDAFNQEKEMLRILANYPDDHVVLHLVSWSQREDHYILYPKAACNLKHFMQNRSRPELKRSVVLWFLRQLEGLALAIDHVHHLKHPTNTDPSPDKDALWGCHYDIKPENILVFEKEPNYHPSLKISDFGVGVFNAARNGGTSLATGEAKGTITYFAPDMDRDGEVSRPFDMWALGCVYLELMVWLFGFFESSDHCFTTERFNCSAVDDRNKDDTFWMRDSTGEYVLKPEVERAITELEGQHCKKMRAFLRVIKAINGLLTIDSSKRWDSLRLVAFLRSTIRQAEADLEKDHTWYLDRYKQNRGGARAGRDLPQVGVGFDYEVSTAGSSRSPSAPSHSRPASMERGQRPDSEQPSAEAVIGIGSVTEPEWSSSNNTTGQSSLLSTAESSPDLLRDEL